jgi:hypothetical protein
LRRQGSEYVEAGIGLFTHERGRKQVKGGREQKITFVLEFLNI